MSDEDLVQCPNNPNHQVPRSQLDEHVNTCKLLMDPNQEMQIRTSSDDEPRPSTSYQESLQEGSSLQQGSLLQVGSSQQEESQIAEHPNLQGRSFQEWRPPKDPTELQEKSSSGLKMPRPNPRSFRKRGILAESEIESSKPKLKQDKKSSFNKSEMRIESYYKILHEKIKLLEKLKIDSSSDDSSSSSSGSTLSLKDTMPDKKKKFLYEMGTEYLEQLRSTSQQTGSSQQESSSPKPKMTGEEILKQTDVERWVIQSSRFMSEVTTPLEVKLEEPPSTRDVLQEQSHSFSVSTETTHDSDRSQKSEMTEEKIPKKMDTEEKNKARVSPTLSEKITEIEVQLEKLSLAKDVPQRQLQSVSSPSETKKDSDRSQKPKMIEEKIPEKIDTEETNKAPVSPTLSEKIAQFEIELGQLSLTADVPLQQLQSDSFSIETKQDSDRSQEPKMTEEKIPEKMDTKEKKKPEASLTSAEALKQLTVKLIQLYRAKDVPQQQLQSVSSPTETKQDSDRSQQSKKTKEKKTEEIDTKAKIETEESHTSSEGTTQLEVELGELSLTADVPQQQQLQSVSSPTETKKDSDRSQKPKMTEEKIPEKIDTEETNKAQVSPTLSEKITEIEVQLEKLSLAKDVPQRQLQSVSSPTETKEDSDRSQKPKMTEEKIPEKIDTEETNKAQVSPTLSEKIAQFEIELGQLSLTADVPLQQLQSDSFPIETKQDSDLSQERKMTEEKIPEKMDTKEKKKPEASLTSAEALKQLTVKLIQLYRAKDVPQQQLQSVSSPSETKQDSDRSQQPKKTTEKKHEEMDTKAKVETEESHTSSEGTTQLEVELGELSLTADVPQQQQLQSVSSPTETKQDSDRSQQPKKTTEKKTEEIDTKAKIETEESHTLSEVITQLEVELVEPSLAADVSQQQLQSVSSPTKTKQDSDRSQQSKKTKEKKTEETDTKAKIETEESHILSEVITQLEVELVEPSLAADVPQQQLQQSVSSPTETIPDSDRLQQPKKTTEKKHEEMDTEAKMEAEESHTLSEVSPQLEVEFEEPSFVEVVPLQQSQPISFQAATTHDSDDSQQPRIISKKEHEEMDTEEKIETEESHTLSQVTIQVEVESEESSLFEGVPQQQSQPFSFPAGATHYSDDSQQPSIISKKKSEEIDTEEKIQTEESYTLSQVTTQVEDESQESSLVEVVPQQQLQSVSFPAATTHDSDDSQQPQIISKKENEEIDTEEKIQTEESHTLSQVIIQIEVESQQEETTDAEVSHIFAEETNSRMVETGEPSLSRDASEIIVAQPGETSYDESPQADISQQASSLPQEGRPQPEARRREETSDIWKFLHSVGIDSPEPIVTLYEDEDDFEPLNYRDSSTNETDASQGEDGLTIRSYRSSRESTDIDKLQKESKSPEPNISSEADGSRRKTKFLLKKRCYHSSTTDEDEGEKIDLEKHSPSAPKKRSKAVVSRGKTKQQLDVSQEASGLKKRSHETSSESTDIDRGDLQRAVRSPKSAISPEADGSQRKKKSLEIARRYDSSSTTDEDKDEKIDLNKPSSSSPKKRSKPVGSRGKTKQQLEVPQEASRQQKRSHETSSESTDIDSSDLQKSGSSPKSAISPEADSSQKKKKFLEIRRRFETASTKDKATDEKIDLDKPSTSSSIQHSKPVVSSGKTKRQLDVPQEASRQRKRSHETSSESTDIDSSDIQESGSSPKSAISPEADSSQRKKKFLEIRRRFETASTKDKDADEKIDLDKPSTSSSIQHSKPVVSSGKTKHQLDVPQEASKLRKRSYETSSESTDIEIDDIPIASSPPKSAISPKGDGSQKKKKFLEIRKRYDSSSKKDEDKDKKKGI